MKLPLHKMLKPKALQEKTSFFAKNLSIFCVLECLVVLRVVAAIVDFELVYLSAQVHHESDHTS